MDAQRRAFEERVYQIWAAYWGCDPPRFNEPGVTLRTRRNQSGSNGIHIWTLHKHAFVECDPSHEAQLRAALASRAGIVEPASARTISAAWPAEEIDALTVGLIFHLFPEDLPERHLPGGFALRRLTGADEEQLRRLEESTSPEEVSEAFVALDHEMACGVFQLRGQGEVPVLVAAASAYEHSGFVDPGVLTHPDYRRRGFGSAALHALCQWAIRQERVLQYRCNQENAASRRLALRLGFTQFSTQESIWLK